MATRNELERLDLHWSQVVKHIYPEIEVVVKGDTDSVETLLSVWETGDKRFERPTEVELLQALSDVEGEITTEADKREGRENDLSDVKGARAALLLAEAQADYNLLNVGVVDARVMGEIVLRLVGRQILLMKAMRHD